MPGRLEFERAIRRSDLPPPSRHLALTIATWADMNTGLIPDRFQPSLSTLEAATGLDRKTVRRHLDGLEDAKWLERHRPDVEKARTEHARTQYVLVIPPGAGGTEPLGLGEESPQPGGGEPPAKGQRAPRARGREPLKSPGKSRKSPKSLEVPPPSAEPKADAAEAKPNRHQVADDLMAAFWKVHKSNCAQSFIVIRGVIRTAISNGIDRDDLARALDRVAKEKRAVSGATLQIAMQPTTPASTAGRHQPYRQRHSDSAYHEGQFF
ncbi:hypothetical protein [Streptomyces chryseus]